ncbi:MAG: nucleoside monophosphate kinase [Alphaproteobacteria bacterium]|nr:nucleoside monophosphate kinase [Alphaproteobacteria bacterium]
MILIFLGPPGSGKGTQSSFLSKHHGFNHLSTGDLLRIESTKTTKIGLLLASMMGSGALVSDEIVNKLIANYVIEARHSNFIIDGYPRTISQAHYLQNYLDSNYFVFHFDIDIIKLKERIQNRFSCTHCGKIYNKITQPLTINGVCDVCGSSEFSWRKDDNAEALLKRVEVYNQEINAILDFYQERQKLTKINADLTSEEVSSQIENIISIRNIEV